MKVTPYMARQYARPSGLFGRLVVSRWLNRVNRRANDAVFRRLELDTNSSVLEVGFGGGELLMAIADHVKHGSVVGLESSEEMVKRLCHKLSDGAAAGRLTVQSGKVEEMPYDDGLFDRVCSVNTLYFWSDLDAGVAELGRVTAPAGRIVLGFGAGTRLALKGYAEQGFRFYSPDAVKDCLQRHALKPEVESVIDRPGRDSFHVVACIKT